MITNVLSYKRSILTKKKLMQTNVLKLRDQIGNAG